MAGHSRPKDGVASLAYVPAIHVLPATKKDVDARMKPGMRRESNESQLENSCAPARTSAFVDEAFTFAAARALSWGAAPRG
jgi:hypothetical protein